MLLSELEFGSLFTYSPYLSTMEAKKSKNFMIQLKNNEYLLDHSITMVNYVANFIHENIKDLPFAHFFESKPVLVPIPKSSLMKADTLWVPKTLADAINQNGFGKSVIELVKRDIALPKSATSSARDRPKAAQHYDSIGISNKLLSESNEILLIDDVITRGATSLGVASKIADIFPKSIIRTFAAIRTMTPPSIFKKIYDPCKGYITFNGEDTFRRP